MGSQRVGLLCQLTLYLLALLTRSERCTSLPILLTIRSIDSLALGPGSSSARRKKQDGRGSSGRSRTCRDQVRLEIWTRLGAWGLQAAAWGGFWLFARITRQTHKASFGLVGHPSPRMPLSCREVRCERGLLGRADGSASWSQLGTTVLAAVYGPLEAPTSKENAEQGVIEIIFKPRAGLSGSAERLHEAVIRQVVQAVVVATLHPRTLTQVTLQASLRWHPAGESAEQLFCDDRQCINLPQISPSTQLLCCRAGYQRRRLSPALRPERGVRSSHGCRHPPEAHVWCVHFFYWSGDGLWKETNGREMAATAREGRDSVITIISQCWK